MILATNASAASNPADLLGLGIDLFITRLDALSTPEVAEGRWNWTRPVTEKEATEHAGGTWGLSLHAAFPPTWERPEFTDDFLTCLEHHQQIPALSPWSPSLKPFAEKVWKASAGQFGMIPVAVVGVHGQFGDAGLPAGFTDLSEDLKAQWTAALATDHNHSGFWCADEKALADFSLSMPGKYGGIEKLNAAWGTQVTSPIAFPTTPEAPYRARLDFVRWYQDGVTAMAGKYLDAAHAAQPTSLLLLPIGPPDACPKTGTDISSLIEAAAKRGAAVTMTNGGYDSFPRNHALSLGLARAAARWYKTPIWLQSASPSDEPGFHQRIAEALCLGSAGFWDWQENWHEFSSDAQSMSRYFTVATSQVDVAVVFPTSANFLRPDLAAPPLFLQGAMQLRDYADFDVIDEKLIASGALSNYRVVILMEGAVWEENTLGELESWVKAGGVLLAYDFGKMATPGGSTEVFGRLFPQAGKAQIPTLREQFEGKVPDTYTIDPSDPKMEWLLDGDWQTTKEGEEGRYASASAAIRLPLKRGEDYSATIKFTAPDEAAGLDRKVTFDGRLIGKLVKTGESSVRFVIPSAWVKSSVGRLGFENKTYRLPEDTRDLGVGILSVTLQRADAKTKPEVIAGRFISSVDARGVAECSAKVGSGLTVFFPSNRSQLSDYITVARKLIYRLSDVDSKRADAPLIDDRRDGVYTSLMSDKLVFFNSTGVRQRMSIMLPGQSKPSSVTVEPRSVAAAPVGTSAADLLLQCEKFVEVEDSKGISRADCSPGSGITAQVVAGNVAISTRVEIEQPGEYALFVRVLRGEDLVTPKVSIDGTAVEGSGVKEIGDVIRFATITLGVGVHTIELSDDQPFTADFIILSNSPGLLGFRFGGR